MRANHASIQQRQTCYLLLSRQGNDAQRAFLSSFANGAFEAFDLERHHIQRAVELIERYGDLPMDLADASLVVLAESLNHGRILSADQRDFNIYRWNDRNPFENLLVR